MSHIARISLHKACIGYKRNFKPSEMGSVKLQQNYIDGTSATRVCYVFSGSEGVEGLLHTKDLFDQVCTALQFTEGRELFNSFEQIVSDTAADRWANLVTAIPEADRDAPRFETEWRNFLRLYTTSKGRDYMVEYLNSAEVQKPHDTECNDHAERMKALIRRANQMEGTVRQIDETDKKNIIFKSFPIRWQQAYSLCGRDVATNTIEEMVDFMATQKLRFDQVEMDRKKSG